MADVFDRSTRSRVMAAIRGTDTSPEMIVRRFLFAHGFRYRLHVRKLPGCPDIVLPKMRTAIFVHGCFWHQHRTCRYAVMPKTNHTFWKTKLHGNRERDARNAARLRRDGWRVLTVWECDLSAKALDRLVRRLDSARSRT